MEQIVKVVMLPTEKANQGAISIGLSRKYMYPMIDATNPLLTNYHLYLVNDEKIKGEGFRLDVERKSIGVIDDDYFYNKTPELYKKVIATTDAYLANVHLPLIPQSFVQAYTDTKGEIETVLVEMEQYGLPEEDTYRLKLRDDNTVKIHKNKMYSQEEVIDMIVAYIEDTLDPDTHGRRENVEKWAEEKLL